MNNRIETSHLPNEPGVYRIVCLETLDCYVGSSQSIRLRMPNHNAALGSGKHWSKAMQAAYDRNGPSAFRIEVLELCRIEDLEAKELEWISDLRPAFNANEPRHGRNRRNSEGFTEHLGVPLDESLKQRLIQIAGKRRGAMTDLARQFIREGVDRVEQRPGAQPEQQAAVA